MDDVFKEPTTRLTDEQYRLMIEDRKAARNSFYGFSVVVVGIIGATVVLTALIGGLFGWFGG